MAGIDLPDDLPPAYRERYGGEHLRDASPAPARGPSRDRIQGIVEGTVALARARHGLSGPRNASRAPRRETEESER
jgi:hypothetical protein